MESVRNFPHFIAAAESADLEMSYRLSADIWTPYFSHRIPFRQAPVHKNRTVAAFISNCNTNNRRKAILDELMEYIEVDSFGACSRNMYGNGDKMTILQHYKFYLAFENSNTEDYVTEKVYHALRVGSVPVYLGAPNIDRFVPSPKSVIKVSDFRNIRELAEYLNMLDENDEEYEKWLEWKRQPFSAQFEELSERTRIDARCSLCMLLHQLRNEEK